jgi:hypothetical protein
MCQPWCDQEPLETLATIKVRLQFESNVAIKDPQLALEGMQNTTVWLDGNKQDTKPTGYFTDEAIQTIALDSFAPGTHELLLQIEYHRKTCIECMYLLGDFGVSIRGRHTCLVAPIRELAFGNWVNQGLPFYAGNVTYHTTVQSTGKPFFVETAHYAGALATMLLDGKHKQTVAFAPYQGLFDVPAGEHQLDITVFGNRVNAFGQLHNAAAGDNELRDYRWWGPGSWRTTGANWIDEYQLWPMGLLAAPRLLKAEAAKL